MYVKNNSENNVLFRTHVSEKAGLIYGSMAILGAYIELKQTISQWNNDIDPSRFSFNAGCISSIFMFLLGLFIYYKWVYQAKKHEVILDDKSLYGFRTGMFYRKVPFKIYIASIDRAEVLMESIAKSLNFGTVAVNSNGNVVKLRLLYQPFKLVESIELAKNNELQNLRSNGG
jgi:hypothetical protein